MLKKISLLVLLLFISSEAKTLVLLYHALSPKPKAITSINPEYFRNHIKEIRDEGFEIISLEQALSNFLDGDTSQTPQVLITFDDGWESLYKYGLNIFKTEKFPVALFIYPRAISRFDGFLKWNEIQEMILSGYVSIGSHGYSHTPLRRDFIERKLFYNWFVEGELISSKEVIEFHTGKVVYSIAYPFGYYSNDVMDWTKKTDYKLGFTTENPLTNSYKNRYAIPRYTITRKDNTIIPILKAYKRKYKLGYKKEESANIDNTNQIVNPILIETALNITPEIRDIIINFKPKGLLFSNDENIFESRNNLSNSINEIRNSIQNEPLFLYKLNPAELNKNTIWESSNYNKDIFFELNKDGVNGVIIDINTIKKENYKFIYNNIRESGLKIYFEIENINDLAFYENQFDGLILNNFNKDISEIKSISSALIIIRSDTLISKPDWANYNLIKLIDAEE